MGGATRKRSYGLPPLANLRAIADARGYTRAQLAERSGLSYPTITKCLEAGGRVRPSTAEALARAVGVPAKALYDDLSYAEVEGRLRVPPVVAGVGYGYPEVPLGAASPGASSPGEAAGGEKAEDGVPAGREKQYVIVHRDEWRALHEALATISGRLEAIEEAVGELATRPIAEFDVQFELKERGQQ